ncbi:FAD-binding oxidoreductase [Microbacterium capsulatum]|uniref:FAD-binding oxidoreductase n=1 Tax=Microbacterium capsulatum TaxID=3041921 RepID=A0ABU0XIR9_9MICO|nr:FAD-binding oxidoreductase [Microbacterium sp. ASV81]MDQ4215035.1 FAD-binding oxidoreductase [Microbacterium sp. ASV81]
MTNDTKEITTMPYPTLPPGLDRAVACDVVHPGEPGYETLRRIWNADIDQHPLAIVRCTTAQDAADALRWCTANDVSVTVRGGGHNLAGTSVADGSVMIDMSLMRDVTVDTGNRTLTVGPGCRWGDVDRAAEPFNVALPAGVVSHTGVAGLVLGGGMGYLSRMFGSTVDFLREVEIVTADGEIRRVNKDNEPELFWALKGAGHNFGIATEFVFDYVDLPGLATVRLALFPAKDRKALLQRFRELGPAQPDNSTTYVRLYRAPHYWSQLPREHRGQPIISVATVTYGDPADEPAITAPIFEGYEPVYTSLRSIPHVTLQHSTDDEFRYGISHYWRHVAFGELPDELLDLAIEHSDAYPGQPLNSSSFIAHQVMCPFELIAGKLTPRDHSNDSTTGIHSRWGGNIGADWLYADERPELVAWVKRFGAAVAQWEAGSYINFTSEQNDAEGARHIYGAKYDRLVDVKRQYDPTNVFAHGLIELETVPAGVEWAGE